MHTTILFSGSCEAGKAAARTLHVKLLGDVRPMFYVPAPRAKSLFGDVYMITVSHPYLVSLGGRGGRERLCGAVPGCFLAAAPWEAGGSLGHPCDGDSAASPPYPPLPAQADGAGAKLVAPTAPAGTNLAAQFSITWEDIPPSKIGELQAAAFKAAILKQLPAGALPWREAWQHWLASRLHRLHGHASGMLARWRPTAASHSHFYQALECTSPP